MLKESPDHYDAELVLKIYDLRREAVMRQSRTAMTREFWPRTAEELVAVTKSEHPLNTAYRQTVGYWEMVFGMAKHGIIHADFLAENSSEGFLLYARIEPFLAQLRQATSPRALQNTEWIVQHSDTAKAIMETMRARVARTLAGK